jgi:hypothetical protein
MPIFLSDTAYPGFNIYPFPLSQSATDYAKEFSSEAKFLMVLDDKVVAKAAKLSANSLRLRWTRHDASRWSAEYGDHIISVRKCGLCFLACRTNLVDPADRWVVAHLDLQLPLALSTAQLARKFVQDLYCIRPGALGPIGWIPVRDAKGEARGVPELLDVLVTPAGHGRSAMEGLVSHTV